MVFADLIFEENKDFEDRFFCKKLINNYLNMIC